MRRLFLAIEIPKYIRSEIAFLSSKLKDSVKGNFVDLDKLHVTVLFIGESKLSTDQIINIVKELRVNIKVNVGGVGVFPDINKPKVLFIDVKTDIHEIYMDLCEKLNITPEKQFHPHVTICRLKQENLDLHKLGELSKFYASFDADKLSLFDSDFRNYHKLY
ncbi:MAG: RNA 2',3'-cyclic phosphodiesterase [Candidatus Parvarchaeota archaeon]|nr:RNA 2',3'-cyclic phosphodiesterase [Candidatus Parvarchaeota archaeon]MCL5101151.1 RNA 2',3'-cyclic phosphodiesterase [Candidatus Parvarchaeota archaeon]